MQAKTLYDKWKREQEEFKREVMNLRSYETEEEFMQLAERAKTRPKRLTKQNSRKINVKDY